MVFKCEVWCVQGMRLERKETLVGMSILSASVTSAAAAEGGATPTVLLVTAQGLGKRLPAEAFKLQHRAGMGNIAIKCNDGDRLMALHVVRCMYPLCSVAITPICCSCPPAAVICTTLLTKFQLHCS